MAGVVRSPRDPLRLSDSLEVHIGLGKAAVCMVIASYSERIQLKVSREKGAESRRDKAQASFHLASSSGIRWTVLNQFAQKHM